MHEGARLATWRKAHIGCPPTIAGPRVLPTGQRALDGDVSNLAVQSNWGDGPTLEGYGDIDFAVKVFGERLFKGQLPPILCTYVCKPRSLGFFGAKRFANREGQTAYEVSLNPRQLDALGDAAALAVLVHLLCQVHRHAFGPKNRKGGTGSRGYHDEALAQLMQSVGLMPSHTGRPEGRQTGFSIRHYVIEGGPFDLVCRELLINGFTLRWRDNPHARAKKKRKEKQVHAQPVLAATSAEFICEGCGVVAYSRASARIGCLDCSAPMTMATGMGKRDASA